MLLALVMAIFGSTGACEGGLHRSRHVREAFAGGCHRSRDHLMLVMLGDGDHCCRHMRDAAGADDVLHRIRHVRDASAGGCHSNRGHLMLVTAGALVMVIFGWPGSTAGDRHRSQDRLMFFKLRDVSQCEPNT